MELHYNIEIERESLSIEKEDDGLWKICVEGRTYFILHLDKGFDLYEEKDIADSRLENEGGYYSVNVHLGRFDDGYGIARYFIENIF